jgi:phytoene dehydrogenase-like protein
MATKAATGQADVLILGGGHNGLVCAAYLAAAGLKVHVLERRHIVGGAAVTEEFYPGFRNSVASYTVSLLNPLVIRDLRLAEHGLHVVERPFSNFLPLPDGRCLRTGGGLTESEVGRWSTRDVARLAEYEAMLDRVVDVLRELSLRTPPNVSDRFVLADWLSSIQVAKRIKSLDMRARREMIDLFTKSAGEVLDHYFECEPLKAVFGLDSIVGNFGSPYSPGSGYVLLHHLFGEVNGKRSTWGHAIGGMGAITQAMAKECVARGVQIETDAGVARVLVRDGRATGVVLEDGRELRAPTIVSNLNPKLLYHRLFDRSDLPQEVVTGFERYRCGSGTFRMNVALSELPDFTAAPGTHLQPHHQAGILIGPSLDYYERAYFDAKSREHNPGWSRAPMIEMVISSALDDTLAPPGAHVASLFCQHVNPEVEGGWDAHRDTFAQVVIDTFDTYAPNFKRSLLGYEALSPLDLERRFGLIGGDIFHGSLGLDQLFSARPLLGMADYRGAVRNLYLCGSGAHPGGGVTGLPGRNAAREILRDLRRGPRP